MTPHEAGALWAGRVAAWVDRGVYWFARHWLALVNLVLLLYVVLPFLAPTFTALGWETAGQVVYLVYRPLCHQLPERSFFLYGEKVVYTLSELQARGLDPDLSFLARRGFVGNSQVGYKLAFCERDLAIYGSFLLAGLFFALTGRRWRPLPWRWYAVLLLPMAVDGLTQLVGLRESTWWLRLVTGGIFGAASVWVVYPHVETAMRDVVASMERHQEGEAWGEQ